MMFTVIKFDVMLIIHDNECQWSTMMTMVPIIHLTHHHVLPTNDFEIKIFFFSFSTKRKQLFKAIVNLKKCYFD